MTASEGEVIGNWFHNYAKVTNGTLYTVSLNVVQLAQAGELTQPPAAYNATAGFTTQFNWNDPAAGDSHCTDPSGTPTIVDLVNTYLARPTNPPIPTIFQEQHPDGTALEGHCVRPGRYLISFKGISELPVDYVTAATQAGTKQFIPVSQSDRGDIAILEPLAYSRANAWIDLLVNYDDVPDPSARIAPPLTADAISAWGTESFSANTGLTTEAGYVLRARVLPPTETAPEEYLARVTWDYGAPTVAQTGFYTPGGTGGWLLRWRQIPVAPTDRCYVIGADVKHMSLPVEADPQSFVRVGVGRACGSGPDLVIGRMKANKVGGVITPSMTMTNVSSVAYTGTGTLNFYLSTDANYGGDTPVGSRSVSFAGGGLGASQSQTVTVSPFTLPTNGLNYYLFAVLSGVTGEGETSNNTMLDTASFTAPTPPPPVVDLVLGNYTPPSLALGSTITMSYVESNIGTDPAHAPWVDRFYLSADGVLNRAADTLFGTTVVSQDQAAGQTLTRSVTLTADPSMVVGVRRLIGMVDDDNQVQEPNEANNLSTSPTINIVYVNGIDVAVARVQGTYAGGSWSGYNLTMRNIGQTIPSCIGNWTRFRYYLSTDSVISANDYKTAISLTSCITASGASWSTMISPPPRSFFLSGYNMPPAGAYYLILKMDSEGSLAEVNENNNLKVLGYFPNY